MKHKKAAKFTVVRHVFPTISVDRTSAQVPTIDLANPEANLAAA